MWTDPEVVKYISGVPLAREDIWMRFCRGAGQWTLSGYGPFVVEDTSSGKVIGEVGPADYQRDIDPPLEGKPEFGWVFARAAHGRGYASEALAAAIQWTAAALPGQTFSCIITPDNTPSLRLAARFGFVETTTAIHKGKRVLVLERRPA
jgi:RimJ/RimL family protein N-acetyltransferase